MLRRSRAAGGLEARRKLERGPKATKRPYPLRGASGAALRQTDGGHAATKRAPTTGARPGASHPAHRSSTITQRTCTCQNERCLLWSTRGSAICSTTSIGQQQWSNWPLRIPRPATTLEWSKPGISCSTPRSAYAAYSRRSRLARSSGSRGGAQRGAGQERQAAHADLDRIPARHALSYADIAAMINELGDIGQALDRADPAGLKTPASDWR